MIHDGNFHFMYVILKNPILKVESSGIIKIASNCMSNLTKWSICKWNIYIFQINGALKDTYVLSNYACYNHNISKL
jgi:hypothetical protein